MNISIVIPNYNGKDLLEKNLPKVIESISSYDGEVEVIIVDGGSTDRTKEVIRPYLTDQRIHYLYKRDRNPAEGRNNGIRISKGKYIAILDSDDTWCDSKKLEKQVRFLEEHPDYVLVGGGAMVLDEEGKECCRVLLPETDEKIRELMLFDCLFPHSTVVFRRDIWKIVGGYNEREGTKGLGLGEDWDLWLRSGEFGKFYNFQEYFLNYMQNKQNNRPRYIIQQNFRFSLKLRKKYRNLYPNFWKAYLFGLAFYFYSFFPFQRWFHRAMPKLKNMLFHHQIYQKTQKNDRG